MTKLLISACALAQAYILFPLTTKAAYIFGDGLTGANTSLTEVGSEAGMAAGDDLPTIVGRGINVFLTILGLFFLVLVVWAGFQYINSKGQAEKTKKAMDMLTNAVIGMVIIIAAYAIANFVLGALSEVGTGAAISG
ncbi:MAG: hypothetical protein V1664_04980 [Candidatus Uhrbacteria bacterium]